MNSEILQYKMNSKIGSLYLVASAKGLRGVWWKKKDIPCVKSLRSTEPAVRILQQAEKELDEYLAGKRKKFSLPLEVSGTEFQRKVWRELSGIPYGSTCSYKDIAAKLQSKAVRAVGTANGRNPLSIIVPCHRVIGADGGLAGYAGGLEIKQKLLNLEKERC